MKGSGHSLPGPDGITREVFDNGITVLVYENFAAQSVFLVGTLNAGGLYTDAAHNGLAALTANALMRGTQNRDFATIHAELEDIGADISVSSGVHKVGFTGKSLAEDLPVLIDVLGDVLRYPVFPTQQVERLKGETMTWLQYRQQDTRWQAGRLFRERLYPPDHPYHYGTHGTLETVQNLNAADLQAFHNKHYGPKGMVISIVGAVQAQAAVDIVRARLGDWQNPAQPDVPALPEPPQLDTIQRTTLSLPGKTQSDLVIGVLGPSRRAVDYQAASLANSILGQFGMMGRIGAVIREDLGLAYYAFSHLEGGYGPGAWSVVAGVSPSNLELTIEHILDEIQRITTEPVSSEDLEDNQSYYTGRLPLQLETNEGIATSILSMENYQLGLNYLENYHEMIYSLKPDDLLAAAQRYWKPGVFVVSIAGPNHHS